MPRDPMSETDPPSGQQEQPESIYTKADFMAESHAFDKMDGDGNMLHAVHPWDVAGIFRQAGKDQMTEREFRSELAKWRGEVSNA